MARPRRAPLQNNKNKVPNPVLYQELGVPNLTPASSWNVWSNSVPKGTIGVGRDPLAPSLDELVFMLRRDGQAAALFKLMSLPIISAFARGSWVAPEGVDEESPEVKFANDMWNLPPQAGGMQTTRSEIIKQILLAVPHGFSAFEIVKGYREEGDLQGKYVIDKLAYRDPRTVTMLVDDHGDFQGFRQQARLVNRLVDVVIKKENSFYWAVNEEQNPMYGVSYFEPAFQHFQMKRKMYYLGEIAAQLSSVPGRLGKIPRGASPRQIAEFKRGLADLHFSQAMILPPDFEVDAFDSNTGFDFLKIIDHHDKQMAGSLLAKFLQQEDRQVLIDNGKADASADLFVQLLDALVYELSQALTNKLMPQFIDYNFGTGVYPEFRFSTLTDDNKNAIFDLFTTMVGLQTINATPEFVRSSEMELAKRFGFPIDYDAVADEEAKAAEEMQKQAAEEAAQQAELQKAQIDAAKQPATAGTGQGNPGSPKKPQGTNKQQRGESSPAPTGQGGRPPTQATTASLKASAASPQDQVAAINAITGALNVLFEPDDVPEYFAPEGEFEPERGEW